MKKKILFIIAIFFSFMVPVQAEEITLTEDMDLNGVVYELTEDLTINGNGHTIKGGFSIGATKEYKLVLKNLVIDGGGIDKIVAMPQYSQAGVSIEIDGVTFLNYKKTALDLSGIITSIDIRNSTFDSSLTTEIDGVTCEMWCELEKRSASAIDLNLRANTNDYEGLEVCNKKIEIGDYVIENNVFKNAVIDAADLETSTAGAIKLKVKELHDCLSNTPVVYIRNNKFINNSRDIVIGTSSVVGSSTSVAESGDFHIYMENNGPLTILNNTIENEVTYEDKLLYVSQFVSDTMTAFLNCNENNYLETYIIENDVITMAVNSKQLLESLTAKNENFHDFINETIRAQANVNWMFYDADDAYSYMIKYEDVKSKLTNTVSNLSLKISDETTIDKLKDYANGRNLFIESYEDGDLPAVKVTYKFATDFDSGSKAYLYYYNSENGLLEKEGECVVDDKSYATFDLTHFSSYIISDVDLINANPATNLNIEAIVIVVALMGMVAILGIEMNKYKIKKQNNY